MKNWKNHKRASLRQDHLERVAEYQRMRKKRYRETNLSESFLREVQENIKRAALRR